MKKTKHTPGEWKWDKRKDHQSEYSKNYLILDDEGFIVAYTNYNDHQLIAAAPDLLEACKRIANRFEEIPGEDNDLQFLRQAISKAKGE